MVTTVFEIKMKDGRVFRVVCMNSTQQKKVIASYNKMSNKVDSVDILTNGIHSTKDWLKMCEIF